MAATRKKIPITILTGFLGSGKTTLMNHILKDPNHGLKFAVIENEYGAVGVDGSLISSGMKTESKEEIIEMMNGCICCNVRGDLIPIIRKLLKRADQFDAIIIETTGLADPSPVIQTFFIHEGIAARCEVDGVITVVDCKHILMHLNEEKPEDTDNESEQQIAYADRILLNKTDLVDAATLAEVKAAVRNINASVEMIETNYSKVDPKSLIGIQGFKLERVLDFDPEFLVEEEDTHDDACADEDCGHEHHKHDHDHCDDDKCDHKEHKHDDKTETKEADTATTETTEPKKDKKKPRKRHDAKTSSVAFRFEGDIVVGKLEQLIGVMMKDLGNDLYRYKGILAVAGKEEKFVFQGVHMLFDGNFHGKWGPDEKRESKFVFIGRNLDHEAIKKSFEDIKAKELRFKIGDKVEANVGTWTAGHVIKLWDDGNPYRIKLDNDEATEIWGPEDSDLYVRSPKE